MEVKTAALVAGELRALGFTVTEKVGITIGTLTTLDPTINNTRPCGVVNGLRVGRAAAAGRCNATATTATLWCIHATSQSGNIFAMQRAANGTVTRICTRTRPKCGCLGVAEAGDPSAARDA